MGQRLAVSFLNESGSIPLESASLRTSLFEVSCRLEGCQGFSDAFDVYALRQSQSRTTRDLCCDNDLFWTGPLVTAQRDIRPVEIILRFSDEPENQYGLTLEPKDDKVLVRVGAFANLEWLVINYGALKFDGTIRPRSIDINQSIIEKWLSAFLRHHKATLAAVRAHVTSSNAASIVLEYAPCFVSQRYISPLCQCYGIQCATMVPRCHRLTSSCCICVS